MEIIKLSEAKFENFPEENLKFAKLYRNEHISISFDKYVVGIKTPTLYKNRPNGGKEILIPLVGKLRINTDGESKDFDPENNGLSIVVIESNTNRQFENIGEKDALVLAIFSPPFSIKELEDFLASAGKKS